jgi:hypothetical protein
VRRPDPLPADPIRIRRTPPAACRHVLQIDHSAEIVRLRWSLRRAFSGRWALHRGTTLGPERWHTTDIETARLAQQSDPVPLVHDDGRALWWFRDHFYWDREGRSRADVKALVVLNAQDAVRRPRALAGRRPW